jgi:hypothetical protein
MSAMQILRFAQDDKLFCDALSEAFARCCTKTKRCHPERSEGSDYTDVGGADPSLAQDGKESLLG